MDQHSLRVDIGQCWLARSAQHTHCGRFLLADCNQTQAVSGRPLFCPGAGGGRLLNEKTGGLQVMAAW
jgi:hypothetical protein